MARSITQHSSLLTMRPSLRVPVQYSEGISLVLHGVKVGGDNGRSCNSQGPSPHGPPQDKPDGPEPMDASAPAPARQESKKEQPRRNARRRDAFVAQKRWATLTQKALWVARRKLRDDTWTTWMRSTFSPRRDARRKIRATFWGYWSKPQFECKEPWAAPLGKVSHRDVYIYNKARKLTDQLVRLGFIALATIAEEGSDLANHHD